MIAGDGEEGFDSGLNRRCGIQKAGGPMWECGHHQSCSGRPQHHLCSQQDALHVLHHPDTYEHAKGAHAHARTHACTRTQKKTVIQWVMMSLCSSHKDIEEFFSFRRNYIRHKEGLQARIWLYVSFFVLTGTCFCYSIAKFGNTQHYGLPRGGSFFTGHLSPLW